jgi:hypothetical protein
MSKIKIMPKKLQIYNIKKTLRKELKKGNINRDIEAEIIDNIDFECLVDNQLTYSENLQHLREYVGKKFGFEVGHYEGKLK